VCVFVPPWPSPQSGENMVPTMFRTFEQSKPLSINDETTTGQTLPQQQFQQHQQHNSLIENLPPASTASSTATRISLSILNDALPSPSNMDSHNQYGLDISRSSPQLDYGSRLARELFTPGLSASTMNKPFDSKSNIAVTTTGPSPLPHQVNQQTKLPPSSISSSPWMNSALDNTFQQDIKSTGIFSTTLSSNELLSQLRSSSTSSPDSLFSFNQPITSVSNVSSNSSLFSKACTLPPPPSMSLTQLNPSTFRNNSTPSSLGVNSFPLPVIDGDPFGTGSSENSAIERLEYHISTIANEISTTIQLHINGLEVRREQLLKQLDHIKKMYINALQTNGLKYSLSKSLGINGNENDTGGLVIPQLANFTFPLPNITFTKPDAALYKAVSSLGFLTTPAFAPNCSATGEGIEKAAPGAQTSFTIVVRNCFNEESMVGGDQILVQVMARKINNGRRSPPQLIHHNITDHNNGKYTVAYVVPRNLTCEDYIQIAISINGLPLLASPYNVPIDESKLVKSPEFVWVRLTSFGIEGNAPGEFCRPWGVCVVKMPEELVKPKSTPSTSSDEASQKESASSSPSFSSSSKDESNEYMVAVADRSNNRIQLFRLDLNAPEGQEPLSVMKVFGSGPGSRPGLFDRPAGIAINTALQHIIVADKDNHRIQVFDLHGNYIFKFGEKGNRPGQFCYPWDVDIDPKTSEIAVSDTRNRRVQLFAPYGQFLALIAQPFESPRGVSFLSSERMIVSDFNKHRLIIIETRRNALEQYLRETKVVGYGEGNGWGEFLRPQGIAVSGHYVYCSDSRNNRVAIWNAVSQTFEYITEDIVSLDRPAGIATCDKVLVVVDFGHNRLQVCVQKLVNHLMN